MLLHEFLATSVARTPDKVALVCADRAYTYAQLAQRAAQLAAELQRRGVARGDRVALFLDNGIELAAGVFAALAAGAVFMPINPLTKADKLAYMLNDSRAAVLITSAGLASVYEAALAQNRSVHHCIVAGLAEGRDPRVVRYPEPVDGRSTAPGDPGLIDQDLASIVYTSGSTGDPKGVMLTHLNMVSAARSVSTYLGLQRRRRDHLRAAARLRLRPVPAADERQGRGDAGARAVVHLPGQGARADGTASGVRLPRRADDLLDADEPRHAVELRPARIAHDHQHGRRAVGGAHPPAPRPLSAGAAVLHVRPHRVQAGHLPAARATRHPADQRRAGHAERGGLAGRRMPAGACPTAAPASW